MEKRKREGIVKSQGGLTRVLDVDVFALLVMLNVIDKSSAERTF